MSKISIKGKKGIGEIKDMSLVAESLLVNNDLKKAMPELSFKSFFTCSLVFFSSH